MLVCKSDMLVCTGSLYVADMVPDKEGKHYFHCSVNEHYKGGMIASYTVTGSDQTVQVNLHLLFCSIFIFSHACHIHIVIYRRPNCTGSCAKYESLCLFFCRGSLLDGVYVHTHTHTQVHRQRTITVLTIHTHARAARVLRKCASTTYRASLCNALDLMTNKVSQNT
jgi:hypothetical protein